MNNSFIALSSTTETNSSEKNTRKRLRFSPPVVVAYLPEISNDEKRAAWWSQEESACIISKALYSADESRKNKVLVDTLDQALRHARRSALALNNNERDSAPELLTEQRLLSLWCQYGHSRRGLEKMVSRVHQTTRDNIVIRTRSKVVALSHSGADPEKIRAVSEKGSRSSAVFATMIATADAEAVLSPLAERRRSIQSSKQASSLPSPTTLATGNVTRLGRHQKVSVQTLNRAR
jgi:hypothetical protein